MASILDRILDKIRGKKTTATPVASPTATPAVAGKSYVVKSGDSLSKIAKAAYGEGKRWPEIYEANKQLIGSNPNMIHPGQNLRIP